MRSAKNYKAWIIGISSLILIMICLIFWLKPSQSPATDIKQYSDVNNHQSKPQNISQDLPTNQQSKTALQGIATSLDGTEVDGEIIIDERKNLVVTYGLRRLFDYFLTTQGELSLEQIHIKVTDYIQSHTPEPASSQAIKIYYQYIDYLQQIADFEKNITTMQLSEIQQGRMDLSIIEQRQRQAKAIRQKIFDKATQEAFFSQEDNLNDYNLAVIQTNQNSSLTEDERQKILNQIRQQYLQNVAGDDKQLQEKLRNQQNINELIAETERLKQQGATPEQITALRRQYVSEDAVARLDEMDRKENAFLAKIQTFSHQKQQIINQYGNTVQSQKMIDELKQQQFNHAEQLRLDVLTKND